MNLTSGPYVEKANDFELRWLIDRLIKMNATFTVQRNPSTRPPTWVIYTHTDDDTVLIHLVGEYVRESTPRPAKRKPTGEVTP